MKAEMRMYPCFDADGISWERVLSEWKWLAAAEFRLLAVSAFGDLFLQDVHGGVHWLDVRGREILYDRKFQEEVPRGRN